MQNMDLVEGRPEHGQLRVVLDDITGWAYEVRMFEGCSTAKPIYQFNEKYHYGSTYATAFQLIGELNRR